VYNPKTATPTFPKENRITVGGADGEQPSGNGSKQTVGVGIPGGIPTGGGQLTTVNLLGFVKGLNVEMLVEGQTSVGLV
jgi:hypothetical protein